MRKTIGQEIFLMLVIPVLLTVTALILYLLFLIYGNAVKTIELEIKELSRVNSATVNGKIDNVKMSVQSTAYILENIDHKAEKARVECENAIISMFSNSSVYNTWLAYEPDAFDGDDRLHTEEYPGAPSGRFIRSFVRINGEVSVAPDMDETILNDEAECPWYAVPLASGEIYVDVDNQNANLYDYKLEDFNEPVYTLSVVMPIKRDGKIIGCVGADIVFDEMVGDIDNSGNTHTAIFYPNGRLFYAPETKYSEESIESLKFSSAAAIKEAFDERRDIFLYNEQSLFFQGKSFAYFMPLKDGLYVFVALPREYAMRSVKTMTGLVGGLLAVVLATVAAFSIFIIKRISNPVEKLILAANAIAGGKMDSDIVITSKTDNAIKELSQSLGTILEQFRSNLAAQKHTEKQFTVYSYMTKFLYMSKTLPDTLRAAAVMFCDYFQLRKATIVYIKNGVFQQESYEKEFGFHAGRADFAYHKQVSALLRDKDIVCLNAYTVSQNGLYFLSEGIFYACILPMRIDREDCGYIILESDNVKENFTAYDESVYTYIANTLSQWLSFKDKEAGWDKSPENTAGHLTIDRALPPAPAAIEAETPVGSNAVEKESACPTGFLKMLAPIPGLDAAKALNMMGGLENIYEGAFRITHRLLPENIAKMEACFEAVPEQNTDGQPCGLPEIRDLNSFTIEVHGIKGSLNNIGHTALGNFAASLENAAKDGARAYCCQNYGDFKNQLWEFYESVKEILDSERKIEKQAGDGELLSECLAAAKACCEDYDALAALESLARLNCYSFSGEVSELLEKATFSLEKFDYEEGLDYLSRIKGMTEGIT